MKPHLIIKLKEAYPRKLPFWGNIVMDKVGVREEFHPSLDRIIKEKYRLPFWPSSDYEPRGGEWSKEEIAAGLNRVYRLILQRNNNIPLHLIKEIELLPQVEYGRIGAVGSGKLPDKTYVEASSLSQKYRNTSIGLKAAHQFSKGNPAVKVAVLDTGFEIQHPEIKQALLPGKDFVNIIDGASHFIGDYLDVDDDPDDEVGHGTHVVGIIAGRGIKMPLGVAPICKILPVKVLGAMQRGKTTVGAGLIDNINNGIKWAVDQDVDVINMSLGIKHTGGGLPHQEVIEYALSKGVTVVAASGNDGTEDKYYPGALPGVIAVGASNNRGDVAPFSTFGGHVYLIAPGVQIYSAYLNDGYVAASGTSQAAPFVAGAIALLKSFALSQGTKLSNEHIRYLLHHTSDRINRQWKDPKAGFGVLNILDALKLLQYKTS